MTITAYHTIADVAIRDAALFNLAGNRIVAELKQRPAVEYVTLKRWWRFDKRIPIRDPGTLTMGELNIIQSQELSYDYFCIVMGIMLGLARHKKLLPDGTPDWVSGDAGVDVDDKVIGKLRFIRAQRYMLQVQEGIAAINKAWKKLEMPPSASGARAKVQRRNRGLFDVVDKYVEIMNGGVTIEKAWNMPWIRVYGAFERQREDNMEQRAMYEQAKRGGKR